MIDLNRGKEKSSHSVSIQDRVTSEICENLVFFNVLLQYT